MKQPSLEFCFFTSCRAFLYISLESSSENERALIVAVVAVGNQFVARTNFHIQVDMCKTQFACKKRSYGANNIEGRNDTFPKDHKESMLNLRDNCAGDVFSSFSFSSLSDVSFRVVYDSASARRIQFLDFVYHIPLHGSPDFDYHTLLHVHPYVLH